MTTPILDHASDVLTRAGYDITETRDLQHGWQLRCAGGEVVCVYTTGKVVAQGKGAAAVGALFTANPMPKPGAVAKPKRVAAAVETPWSEPNDQEFGSRYPPGWSETWSEGDIPF